MSDLFLGVAATAERSFPWYFLLVYVVGFVAAVGIGSVAWYNSKRPAGWEGAKRPDNIPDLSQQTSSEDTEA